jgi:hypothetical protein
MGRGGTGVSPDAPAAASSRSAASVARPTRDSARASGDAVHRVHVRDDCCSASACARSRCGSAAWGGEQVERDLAELPRGAALPLHVLQLLGDGQPLVHERQRAVVRAARAMAVAERPQRERLAGAPADLARELHRPQRREDLRRRAARVPARAHDVVRRAAQRVQGERRRQPAAVA